MKTSKTIQCVSVFVCVLAIVLGAGCSRGPDKKALQAEVQEKLGKGFQPGVLELVSLKRQGSAPLQASETGAKRLIVYFNATIKLLKNYDFGDWEGLSPASLANVLGATEKGISGIKPQENRQGDLIRVFGSSTYERAQDKWVSVDVAKREVAKPTDPGNAAPSSRAQQLIERLASMVEIPPPGLGPQNETVISEELDRAVKAINARIERQKHIYTIASGTEEGEYYPIVEAIVNHLAKMGAKAKVRNQETEGSVSNVWLIGRKEVDYALIQNNVAAMAVAGEGPFAQGGAVTSLRALGSLFPEPVQIIVLASSSIKTVADLRGKKVDIGMPDSGTHHDALQVLGAYGLAVKDLAEVREKGLEDAAGRLGAGRLDAFFVTVGAPTRELQKLATRHKIRLLSLDNSIIERLVTENPGLIRLTLPANTYPGQAEQVTTVAATALLVTHSDAPQAEVSLLLKLIFEKTDYLTNASAQGAKISKRSGLRGITIPVHAGATQYFGTTAAPPMKDAQTKPQRGKGAAKP
jgi:TRAP transporter TAXI family solute receptor